MIGFSGSLDFSQLYPDGTVFTMDTWMLYGLMIYTYFTSCAVWNVESIYAHTQQYTYYPLDFKKSCWQPNELCSNPIYVIVQ